MNHFREKGAVEMVKTLKGKYIRELNQNPTFKNHTATNMNLGGIFDWISAICIQYGQEVVTLQKKYSNKFAPEN